MANMKLSKGLSWIKRDQTYRVQWLGMFIGQRKTLPDALLLLGETRKNPLLTRFNQKKKLPRGVTFVASRNSYRLRYGQKTVKQSKDLCFILLCRKKLLEYVEMGED